MQAGKNRHKWPRTHDRQVGRGLVFTRGHLRHGLPAVDARDKRIFDLWLACWTDQEIAESVGITHQAVNLVLQETADLPKLAKSDQAASSHATDFDPPLYNVWKQQ